MSSGPNRCPVDGTRITAAVAGHRPNLSHCERLAAVEHLKAQRLSHVKIADILGKHPRQIDRDSAELRDRKSR